jgi:ankyrin repeat protein
MANNQQNIHLFEACNNNNIENVNKFISEGGVDVNGNDKYGFTPLFIASIRNNVEIADLLILNGADVNPKYIDKPDSPLLIASSLKHLEMVELLLSKGAEVNYENKRTITPLFMACLNNNIGVIEVLLHYGAEPHKRNKKLQTPYGVGSDNVKKFIDSWNGHFKGIRVLKKLCVYNPIACEYGLDENGFGFDECLSKFMG